MTEQQAPEMNPEELFLEESFTDQRIGTIRRLTPVDTNGNPRKGAAVEFYGSAQMMTQAGAVPLNFAIEAATLGEAAEKFADGAQQAVQETMEEFERMRREQASSIVLPGQGGAPGAGSKIQLP